MIRLRAIAAIIFMLVVVRPLSLTAKRLSVKSIARLAEYLTDQANRFVERK